MKDTTFWNNQTINLEGKLLDLSTPKVMAIVNVTPDSFYDGGKHDKEKDLLFSCEKHLNEGASLLDIGGQSTRPGSMRIGSKEELQRVIPAIASIKKSFPEALISIDTYSSEVARAAVDHGACMINDISSGQLDRNMLDCVVEMNIPYVSSHLQGNPSTMQNAPSYKDVVTDVFYELSQIKEKLFKKGFNDLIIDPGFGFGKTMDQNFSLLQNLDHFKLLKLPILVGLSRKSMIWKTLNTNPESALNGTTTLNTVALLKGANILRVHDCGEATECVKLIEKL